MAIDHQLVVQDELFCELSKSKHEEALEKHVQVPGSCVRVRVVARAPRYRLPQGGRTLWSYPYPVQVSGSSVRVRVVDEASGSEAGSYLRLTDFVYHSALGWRVIKKREEVSPLA